MRATHVRKKKAQPVRRRASQARSKTTVQRILNSATELIVEKGAKATMTDIAKHAGLVIGSLYQYFADKSAIHRAILMQHNAGVRMMLHSYASKAKNQQQFVEFIEEAFEQYFALHQQDPLFNGLWSIVQTDADLQRIDFEDSLQNGRYVQTICKPMLPNIDGDRLMTACALIAQLALATARFARELPPHLRQHARQVFRGVIRDTFAALKAENDGKKR
jgi:AcrR family transcriptional regulator